MIRLLRAELSRLRSRRLTWIAAVAVLLAVAGLQVAAYQSMKPLSAAELAQGQAQFEQAKADYEANKADYEANAKDCIAQGIPADECDPTPKPENYANRQVVTYADFTTIAVTVVVFLTTLAVLFVSASFIGAEYSSGALANWLSFIPERGKVFASKLLAVVLGAAVATVVTVGLTIGASAVLANLAGARVTGVGNVVETGGRGILIGVIGAVLGFTLAMLTRHTIAAAGAVLGYLLLSFILNVLSGALPALNALKSWLPENNVLAFLNHGYTYQTEVRTVTADGFSYDSVDHVISFAHSAGYWAVIVAVAIGVTFAVFRRRDVN